MVPFLSDIYLKTLYSTGSRDILIILRSYYLRVKSLIKLLFSKSHDILWIEKELLPWMPAIFEQVFFKMHIPVIIDYDDPIFHSYDVHPSLFVRIILGNKIKTIMKKADVVLLSSTYMHKYAQNSGARRAILLPTVIDLDRYTNNGVAANEVFTIGWIGSPSTTRFLHVIEGALIRILNERKVRIVLIGSGRNYPTTYPVTLWNWTEESEAELLQKIDVGIMPLSDEPWAHAKDSYKLIQYMASGKPVIATPYGDNSLIVENYINGFLAETEDEWVSSIKYLTDNKTKAHEMGRAGRKIIEEKYCSAINGPILLEIIRDLIEEYYD